MTRLLKAVLDDCWKKRVSVRVSRIDGQWRLKLLAQDEVEVIYEVHAESGSSVPSWQEHFAVDTPLDVLWLRDAGALLCQTLG